MAVQSLRLGRDPAAAMASASSIALRHCPLKGPMKQRHSTSKCKANQKTHQKEKGVKPKKGFQVSA